MDVLFETAARRRLGTLAPGAIFRLYAADVLSHTLLARSSPYLAGKVGKVYSVRDGDIHEHDPADIVFVLEVTRQP